MFLLQNVAYVARSGSCSKPTNAVCDAVAYTLKFTVGLNKSLLLNIKKRFAEVVTVSQITSFETGGETSREVAKRPSIETSKGAKRSGGDTSR